MDVSSRGLGREGKGRSFQDEGEEKRRGKGEKDVRIFPLGDSAEGYMQETSSSPVRAQEYVR